MASPRVRISGGILVFHRGATAPESTAESGSSLHRSPGLQVLLGHMGGPFWQRRHEGAWTLPKGEPNDGEELLAAARREFREELGIPVPDGQLLPLGSVRQSGGKVVSAWAVESNPALDLTVVVPGTFTMEWPPRSGRTAEFPELDRVEWFDLVTAQSLIVKAQALFLSRLGALTGDMAAE